MFSARSYASRIKRYPDFKQVTQDWKRANDEYEKSILNLRQQQDELAHAINLANKSHEDVLAEINPLEADLKEWNEQIRIKELPARIADLRTHIKYLKEQKTKYYAHQEQCVEFADALHDRKIQENIERLENLNKSYELSVGNMTEHLNVEGLSDNAVRRLIEDRLSSDKSSAIKNMAKSSYANSEQIKQLRSQLIGVPPDSIFYYKKSAELEALKDHYQVDINHRLPRELNRELAVSEQELKNSISQLETQKDVLEVNSPFLQDLVANNQLKLKPLKERQKNIEEELTKLKVKQFDNDQALAKLTRAQQNHFSYRLVKEYWLQPERLLENLITNIRDEFERFNLSYPANQSVEVRMFLADLEHKMNAILSYSDSDAALHPADKARLQYRQLRGYLEFYATQIKDKHFVAACLNAANYQNERVEDNALFAEFITMNLWQMFVSNERLSTHEEEVYAQTCKTFESALKNIKDDAAPEVLTMRSKGYELLRKVEKNKDQQKLEEPFDLKFHTTFLHKATQLIVHPENKKIRAQFRHLTDCNQNGKFSLGNVLKGIGLQLLGVAIIVASYVGIALTHGACAPAGLVGSVAGAATLGIGFNFFSQGLPRGEHKRMANLGRAARKVSDGLEREQNPHPTLVRCRS